MLRPKCVLKLPLGSFIASKDINLQTLSLDRFTTFKKSEGNVHCPPLHISLQCPDA